MTGNLNSMDALRKTGGQKPCRRQKTALLFSLLAVLLTLPLQNCNNADKFADLGWEEINRIRNGQKKDASIALNYFDQALVLEPRHVRALHGSGVILGSNPQTRKIGMKNLRDAIEADPLYSEAYIDLAEIKRSVGLKDAALELLDEGLQVNPRSVKLLIARAAYLGDTGQFLEAMNTLSEAGKLQPDNSLVPYNRALLKVQQKEMDEALKHFTEAIKLKADEPDYLSGKARTLLHQKVEFEKELADLKTLIANTKQPDQQKNDQLESLQKSINEKEAEARSLVARALEINPKHRSSLQLRYDVLDKDRVAEILGLEKEGK